MASWSLADIAEKISAKLHGDPHCKIDRVESLAVAKPGAITFLANPHYHHYLLTTTASAVILRAEDVKQCNTNALVVDNPELQFARLLNMLYPQTKPTPGIHSSAIIGKDCQIDPSVSIGAYCVIEDRVEIGAETWVGAGSMIGADCKIGGSCHIYPRVTLYNRVKLGNRVIVHSGAVLGADGFGLTHDGRGWVKIPQIGQLIIGDEVEIGANTTIDRGALQNTVIGNGVKMDNLVQIGHNVKIGDHTAIAGCVGIAGSADIGRNCMIGGGAGINGHITVTDQVMVTGMTTVMQSVEEPGVYSSAMNLQKHSVWRRNMLRFAQLDKMAKRLSQLEQDYEQCRGQMRGDSHDADGHRGD